MAPPSRRRGAWSSMRIQRPVLVTALVSLLVTALLAGPYLLGLV